MVILIDLDGTLTDTAHTKFKPFKDGKQQFVLSDIPIMKGAIKFINDMHLLGHRLIIISDSHPQYVTKIARGIFNISAVSLADKPNIEKSADFIQYDSELKSIFKNKDNFILIGDSWLDVELGRRLNIRTVLTKFYKAIHIEERDGIGQEQKPMKMGATYYASTFAELSEIIQNPIKNLLALEALFHGEISDRMVKFHTRFHQKDFIAFRCLARQEDGECDRFASAGVTPPKNRTV